MAGEGRGRVGGGVRVVSMSVIPFVVAALLAGLALSHARPASAQAPDAVFWIPPDSDVEIGDPVLCPPDTGVAPLDGERGVTVHVLQPEAIPGYDWPLPVPRWKPMGDQGNWLRAMGTPAGGT